LEPHPQRPCHSVRFLEHVLVRALAEGTGLPEDSKPGDLRDGPLYLFQTLAD